MTGESLTIIQNQLEKLKQLFPETITEGKIDWEKLQATLGKENIEFNNERYVLNWAGKSEAFKVLQQSTTATLKPVPEESLTPSPSPKERGAAAPTIEEFLQSDCGNLFIEGENLEVLKVLQKAYYNKIKCIIIDPPYNTGNDSFIYLDSFKESKEEYQKRIGEKDEEGYLMKEGFFRKNSRDSGHYHSNWLSMMYPRLFLAKNLLRDDGVIFVHIDDNEVHNLRMIMNEIFGEENFVASIIWQKKYSPQNDATYFSIMHDYIICVAKSKKQVKSDDDGFDLNLLERTEEQNARYSNPDRDKRGDWKPGDVLVKTYNEKYVYEIVTPTGRRVLPPKGRCWRYSKEKFKSLVEDNRIWFGLDGASVPSIKRFLSEVKQGIVPSTLWLRQEVGDNQEASNELKELLGGLFFETPKPSRLIKRILELSTENQTEDIVFDFFGGSGTTAQAVLELNKEDGGNRKFILIQLPEPCDEASEAFKAGYKTIADISKERIRRVIKRLNHDSPDSKIAMIKGEEAQQKLFTEEKKQDNHGNQINPINHSSDNGFKVFKLSPSNFKIWRGSEITDENLEQQLELFTDPVREGSEKENMLYELILKAGYLLTDKVEFVIASEAKQSHSEEQIASGKNPRNDGYYSVNDGELIIVLEEMNQEIIDTILTPAPSGRAGVGLQKVITLDQLFTGNDQLKTNTVLQMRDAEIDFKTI